MKIIEFLQSQKFYKEIWHIDSEGWAIGLTDAGDIFVGYPLSHLANTYYKNTPEDKKLAISYWKTNSFAREIKL